MSYYILKGEDNDGFCDMTVIDILQCTEEEARFKLSQYEASIEKYPYYLERKWYKLLKEI
jgi:hypothetical protein